HGPHRAGARGGTPGERFPGGEACLQVPGVSVGEGGKIPPVLTRQSFIGATILHWPVVVLRKLRTGEPMDKDLFDFLQAFREETTRRFDEVSQRFDKMERETSQRFDKMDHETSQRFDKMERETSQRFDKMERETSQRFDETSQRFEKLEIEVRGLYIVVENLR